jgi:hypothetical protein
MKHVLGVLGACGVAVGLLFVASPAKGQAVLHRIVHFVDPVPPAVTELAEDRTAPPPAALGAAPTPEWRRREREGDRLHVAGRFPEAAAAFLAGAEKAPAAEATRLKGRADRSQVYRLLAEERPTRGHGDRAGDEAEFRRRLEALPEPTAADCLALADFAAGRGLNGHLAFLYDLAFERKKGFGGPPPAAVQEKVTAIVRQKKGGADAPAREVLDALIREMPTSEAADLAREATGLAGIGGTERRPGAATLSPEDRKRLDEAIRLFRLGDAEYLAAVPGSKDVNVHRRAALDAFTKARGIFEDLDRRTGFATHTKEIGDCNRNIAELRKDLPIGK